MKKTFLTSAFASLCLASFAEQAKEVQPAKENVTTEAVKKEESCRLTIFQTIEDKGFGSFSGQVQSLTTYRNLHRYKRSNFMARAHSARKTRFFYDEPAQRGQASTLALTLNYASPEFHGFSFNGQYIANPEIFSHHPEVPNNHSFYHLNEANIKWNMQQLGLEKTTFKAGRILTNDANMIIMPKANPRQKDQAFEGVILESKEFDNHSINIGWINSFSSWSTEDKIEYYNENFNYEFTKVADLLHLDYKTDGTYFVDYTYTGINSLTLNFSDFWSEDILNTATANAEWQINDNFSFRQIYSHQDSVGQSEDDGGELNSTYLESSLKFKFCAENEDYLRLGFWHVKSDNNDGKEHNYVDLFQADFAPAAPMMGNQFQLSAGTTGYFVESYAEFGKSWIWTILTHTNTPDKYYHLYDGTEFNIMWGYNFTNNFSMSIKAGLAFLDSKSDYFHDTTCEDYRLSFTYKF